VRQITDGGEEKILVEEDVASLGMFLRAGKKDYFRVQ
jgi:hypothetical protein